MAEMENGALDGAVNVNVGVLGHVDSGKTHLVRVLSTHLSTAALDKHPQSQQRGMTLDLGFSAFRVASPLSPRGPAWQITLVDCPGHASLFKTILGGVHIIDCVLLVVDVLKGLQPQTIECLLLAQLAVDARIVVAVNKVDLLPQAERAKRIEGVTRDIREFLTRFLKIQREVPVVAVAAAPTDSESEPIGIGELVDAIRAALPVPSRDGSGPLCFAIDHCFAIQGNGTILTGTVLSGSVSVRDEVELPALQVSKKVKSMQMFKRSVTSATQGDRVALRVNGLDASLVERGVAVAPKSLPFVSQVVVRVQQIPLFRSTCKSGAKIHATVGHTTVVAVATFFKAPVEASTVPFDPATVYRTVSQVESVAETHEDAETVSSPTFDGFALLQFEQPVICPPKSIVVCSRFDLDPKKYHCRLAFHGAIEAIVWDDNTDNDGSAYSHTRAIARHVMRLSELKIGNVKERAGFVDKPVQKTASTPATEVLARDMFAKDVDWQVYTETTVMFEQSKVLGRILGPFGKSGKFRIELLKHSSSRLVVPESGEKVVLRFIKLTTIRPLKRAATTDSKSGKKGALAAASQVNNRKESRKLLQDDHILYPEAFLAPATRVDTDVPVPTLQASSPPPVTLKESSVPRVSGRIERLKGETTTDGRNPFVIVTGLFSDEASALAANGHRVRCLLSQQPGVVEDGEIEKPFGKAGKVRVLFSAHGGTLGQVGDVIELL